MAEPDGSYLSILNCLSRFTFTALTVRPAIDVTYNRTDRTRYITRSLVFRKSCCLWSIQLPWRLLVSSVWSSSTARIIRRRRLMITMFDLESVDPDWIPSSGFHGWLKMNESFTWEIKPLSTDAEQCFNLSICNYYKFRFEKLIFTSKNGSRGPLFVFESKLAKVCVFFPHPKHPSRFFVLYSTGFLLPNQNFVSLASHCSAVRRIPKAKGCEPNPQILIRPKYPCSNKSPALKI